MKELFIGIVGISLFVVGLLWFAITVERHACNTYGIHTGLQTNYDWPAGCFITTEDGVMLWEEYKYRYVAKEGLAAE